MWRKYLWIPFVLLILAAVFILWARMPRGTITGNELYRAVPTDVALLIKGRTAESIFRPLRRDNPIWNELMSLGGVARFDRQLQEIDSLVLRYQSLAPFYRQLPCVLAVYQITPGKAGFLLITGIPGRQQYRRFSELLRNQRDSSSLRQRPYENTRIYQWNPDSADKKRQYHFSLNEGLFIFSNSAILTEKAIRQMQLDSGIGQMHGFAEVSATAGKNVEANIFIQINRFADLASILMNREYSRKAGALASLGNWAELDLNVKEDALLFNGFSYATDTFPQLLNLFGGQTAREREIEQVLPASTVWFASFAAGNIDEYRKRLKQLSQTGGKERERNSLLEEISESSGVNLMEMLADIYNGEAALVMTDIRNTGVNGNLFAVVSVKSQHMAMEELERLAGGAAGKTGKPANHFLRRISIDRETELSAWELPSGRIPELWFGSLFGGGHYRFASTAGNYLVFGSNPEALSGFVHQYMLGRTLANDLLYADFSEYLSSRTHFHFFINLPRVPGVLPEYFKPEVCSSFEKDRSIVQKLQGLAFQFNSEGRMVYNNLFLKYSPVYREITRTVWESLLDTTVTGKPQLVINHNTGDREILVQDAGNNLYLLNAAGRILWKIPLREAVMGEAQQIDFYRNGKLQYLFNTRHQLHLIDRNGNYVERFPVNLRSPATSPMALFDYEGDKNYRIFIAADDREIYAYSKDGNLVSGWAAEKTEHPVTLPVQHLRVGTRDYIVFHDSYRSYILDRRGSPRVIVREQFAHSRNNSFIPDFTGNHPARLVTTDETGRVKFIYFDGRVETMDIAGFGKDHFFEYTDLDGNGSKEFVYLDSQKLSVYNADKGLRFGMDFETEIKHPVFIYEFSRNDRKIGIVESTRNRIYLLNQDGKLYKGFPQPGSSPFTIGRLRENSSQFNLVVGGRDNFLMNYSVQ